MLRYLAKWFGLMIAELVLQFGVFAHRSDALFLAIISDLLLDLAFWVLGIGGKDWCEVCGKSCAERNTSDGS